MALVLRKVILPKNVSLLKCIKGQGRSIASSANKKPAAILSAVNPRRRMKYESKAHRRCMKRGADKIPRLPAQKEAPTLRFCRSIPMMRTRSQPQVFSSKTRPVSHEDHNSSSILSRLTASFAPAYNQITSRRAYSKCPPPCGSCCGCNCLPPPCNTPPKCIQYMTGYYYYPYGSWFCGPYHVSGTCVPVGCPDKCGPCPACCCVHPSSKPSDQMTSSMSGIFPAKIQAKKAQASVAKQEIRKASGLAKFLPFSTTVQPKANVSIKSESKERLISPTLKTVRSFSSNTKNFNSEKYKVNSSLPPSNSIIKLTSPKILPTPTERDRPNVPPGSFDYSSVPNYKNPYPPQPFSGL